MSENELLQWVGVGVGGLAGGAVLYGFLRFVKQQNAIWPDAAKKYGLKHTQTSESIPLGNSRHFERLEGPALGVVSMNESIGRTRRRSTAAATFTLSSSSARSAAPSAARSSGRCSSVSSSRAGWAARMRSRRTPASPSRESTATRSSRFSGPRPPR
jgi:hypothetical protein